MLSRNGQLHHAHDRNAPGVKEDCLFSSGSSEMRPNKNLALALLVGGASALKLAWSGARGDTIEDGGTASAVRLLRAASMGAFNMALKPA